MRSSRLAPTTATEFAKPSSAFLSIPTQRNDPSPRRRFRRAWISLSQKKKYLNFAIYKRPDCFNFYTSVINKGPLFIQRPFVLPSSTALSAAYFAGLPSTALTAFFCNLTASLLCRNLKTVISEASRFIISSLISQWRFCCILYTESCILIYAISTHCTGFRCILYTEGCISSAEHAFPPFFGNIGAIVSSGSVTASWLLYLILMIVGVLQTSKSVTGAWLLYQKGVR